VSSWHPPFLVLASSREFAQDCCPMMLLDYMISALGLVLVAIVLWRGSRQSLLRHYPFFYSYLGYVFALHILALWGAQLRLPGYALVFWWGSAVAALLRFFVVWEVFRQSFSPLQPIRQIAGQAAAFLVTGLAVAVFLGSDKLSSLYRAESFFPDLERKLGLIQASLLLTCLFLARYYAIPLGRNIWGLALGLGIYLSISVMNFSALELIDSFLPFWRYIRPLSFIGMAGLWTWALWSYAPNPQPTASPEVERHGLERWRNAWGEARTAVRRVVGL